MSKKISTAGKQVPVSTYIIISVIGFIVSIFCIYYYFSKIQGSVGKQASSQAFYLILILFGISASAIIFGVMNSYGVLKGEKMSTQFQLTGPVVGVVLIVLGGFYLPKDTVKRTLAVLVTNEQNIPVSNGKVILYLPNYTREQSIDDKGSAVFNDISDEVFSNKLKIDIASDGYSRKVFDTMLKNTTVLPVILSKTWLVQISGRVTDADEVPIADVEVLADGTRFYGKTITDGTYSFDLFDYNVGDKINLVTSHKGFKDKTRSITISKQQMPDINFTLQPLRPN